MNIVISAGRRFNNFISYVGRLTLLFLETVYLSFVPPYKFERILTQAKRVGPESFLISALASFFVGMIIALQMAYQMVQLSAEIYIPNVVALSITRELAPVLTALIVAGRIGAGITAEIGSMAVSEQIDALRAFAVNPVKFLVVPRFIALAVMMPVLTIFADLIGILGGFVICVFKLGIYPQMYVTMVNEALQAKDIVTGLIKTIFFGAIIALVGCLQGMKVTGGAEGVGRSTTQTVVISFILIIMADCLFTTLFYFIFKA